jgi:hypothetical protein
MDLGLRHLLFSLFVHRIASSGRRRTVPVQSVQVRASESWRIRTLLVHVFDHRSNSTRMSDAKTEEDDATPFGRIYSFSNENKVSMVGDDDECISFILPFILPSFIHNHILSTNVFFQYL